MVQEILQQMEPFDDIGDWENWSERATSETPFESVARSMVHCRVSEKLGNTVSKLRMESSSQARNREDKKEKRKEWL